MEPFSAELLGAASRGAAGRGQHHAELLGVELRELDAVGAAPRDGERSAVALVGAAPPAPDLLGS